MTFAEFLITFCIWMITTISLYLWIDSLCSPYEKAAGVSASFSKCGFVCFAITFIGYTVYYFIK